MTVDGGHRHLNQPPCWEILGIDPTENRDRIRKAYAQRVKSTHPEDDAEGFQTLREAYEAAMNHALGKATVNSPAMGIDTTPPAPVQTPLGPPAEKVFDEFHKCLTNNDHADALAVLAAWWFDPAISEQAKRRFNRCLLDHVLDKGIPQPFLAQLAWQIYWPGEKLHFPVEAPRSRQYAFRQRLLQAIQTSIWDIRIAFAQKLASGQTEAGIAYVQGILASPQFDHLEKRHLLRVTMLRYLAGNRHIEAGVLKALDALFRFSHFLQSYSGEDLAKAQALGARLARIASGPR